MRFALSTAALILPILAQAQTWPVKPIRLHPTVAAGSATDITARILSPRMSEALGQPIIVENISALGGQLGAERLSKAAPDGYTLMITTPSSVISAFFLKKSVPYKLSDFAPITAAVEPVTTFLVHPAVPARNVAELIDYAKKNPGKLSYGTPGVGSVFHLIGEAFQANTGTRMLHVPYKSLVTAINDVISGESNMTVAAVGNVRQQLAAGKLRVLAVLESQRWASMPDIPTIGETVPNFEKPPSWFGYFGPAGLPAPIANRFHAEAVRALNAPEAKSKLDNLGLTAIGNNPEEFAAMIKKGFAVYGAVVKTAGLQPED
jgi:tripartite-type tricarboxylate transporter receptor subunit TctC